jgi:hypothetical protein
VRYRTATVRESVQFPVLHYKKNLNQEIAT